MKRIPLKNVAGAIFAHDLVRSRRVTRVSRSFSVGLAVFSFISVFGFAVVAHANSVTCVPYSLPYTWTVSSIKGEYSVLALYPTKLTDEVPVAIPFTVTRSLDSYCNECGSWNVDDVDPNVSFKVSVSFSYDLTIDAGKIDSGGFTAYAEVGGNLHDPFIWSESKSVPYWGPGSAPTNSLSDTTGGDVYATLTQGGYTLDGSVTARITWDSAYGTPQFGGAQATLSIDPPTYEETDYLQILIPTSEPSSVMLLFLGLIGLVGCGSKK